MNEPSPADFGLTLRQIERYTRLDERTAPRLCAWFCGLAAIGGALYGLFLGGLSLVTPIAVFLFAIQWFAVAFLPCLIIGAYWQSLAGVIVPSLRQFNRFAAAKRGFAAWELRTRIDFWRAISGRTFEAELAATFSRLGYEAALTPVSGDEGVDIVLKKNGKTIIVQCKATANPVGPAVARELYGTLLASAADEAVLAATAGVTAGVRRFVSGKPIRVFGMSEILALHAGNDYPMMQELACTV
jgi:restriction system protein